MQENNFEKQVQQKTDELRLQPSDEVWHKVAAAITKKEGGRRVLIALILLLVLTCSSVFIILHHSGRENLNRAENKVPGKITQIDEHSKGGQVALEPNTPAAVSSTREEAAVVKHLPTEKEHDSQNVVGNDLLLKTTPSKVMHKPADRNSLLVVHNNEQAGPLKNKNKLRYKTGRRPNVVIRDGAQMNVVDENTSLNNTSNVVVSAEIPAATNANTIKEQLTDTVSINPAGQRKQLNDVPANNKEDVTVKGATPSGQKNKWKIGAKISVGGVATQNSYLGIIGPGSAEDKALDAVSNPTTGNNGGQGTPTRYYPSKTKSGTGIIFGLFVEKAISTHTNFSAGLNYKIYNSSWMIGTRVDSTYNLSNASFFYRNGSTNNYKNRFQFLELPVAVRVKLGRQNKVPIYLNLGFSISHLLSSNALQFDTLSGTYYSDNAVFNKTIANISGGLLFSLTPQSKNPLLIGPEISFSLNKMAESGIFEDRHYSYFGIVVQKTFSK